MRKVFDYINLEPIEVQNFIESNKLTFVCNENMQIETTDSDFRKLINEFPELDYAEV